MKFKSGDWVTIRKDREKWLSKRFLTEIKNDFIQVLGYKEDNQYMTILERENGKKLYLDELFLKKGPKSKSIIE